MTIQIPKCDVGVTDVLRSHVERRLRLALARFADRIGRVAVRFSYADGDASGRNKRWRVLLDRDALARQDALADEQVLGVDDANVTGDHVAGAEMNRVAGDELRDRDLPGRAVAPHGRRHGDHRLELGRSAARPGLLNQLEPDAERDHEDHHASSPGIAGRERDRGQPGQQDHQRVKHRVPQELPQSGALFGGEHVGPVLGQTCSRLVGSQALRPGLEPRVDAGPVHGR
jgi:hypothetical protein